MAYMTKDLTKLEKIQLIALLEEKANRKKYNQLREYKPYPKQAEFHAASKKYNERMLGAANQSGKSFCGSIEATYHATGLYPDDWQGRRFRAHNVGWVGGLTGEVIRDTTQKLLLGRIQEGVEAIGTGALPRDRIIEMTKARGTPDLLDHISVRHIDEGVSLIFFKSYATGREKWQGETVDWVWFDEEPPYDIYSEGRTRTNNGQLSTFAMLTCTPLLGMTDVINSFYQKPTKAQTLIMMTIYDVDHYTDEERASIVASYQPWEVDARTMGIPMVGKGRVFKFDEDSISEPHIIHIADHWALLNAADFGWDHPQALVQIAWDKDNDVIHVIRGKKERETTPEEMWVMTKAWAAGIPTAWPHDGLQHDKGSGLQLAEQYRGAGFDLLYEHATHEEGGFGVQAGIIEMIDRFGSGRLKIDEGLADFWDEYRMYHVDNGKIVKLHDDFISAVRYAIMMKRFAKSKAEMNYVYVEPDFFTDMP